MIGLEKTFYNVSSGENELVEFCAVVVVPTFCVQLNFLLKSSKVFIVVKLAGS